MSAFCPETYESASLRQASLVAKLIMAFLVPSLGSDGGSASRRQIMMAVCILTLATVGK
jgi:hypothetical protein